MRRRRHPLLRRPRSVDVVILTNICRMPRSPFRRIIPWHLPGTPEIVLPKDPSRLYSFRRNHPTRLPDTPKIVFPREQLHYIP